VACPNIVDGGESLQVLRAVVNVFNKELQKIDKVCSSGVVDLARSYELLSIKICYKVLCRALDLDKIFGMI